MNPKYIEVKETPSTNTYLAKVGALLPHGTIIFTNNQTIGRGQRGNSWEATPGANLTFSLLLKGLTLPPNRQFHLSEAVSLAMVNVLSRYAEGFSIKWPNDIYYKDSKIAGILIENVLAGNNIIQSVVGIGLNVNQEVFNSDAPNPISLKNITGTDTPLTELLHEIGNELATQVDVFTLELDEDTISNMHTQYLSSLYWKDEAYHPFHLHDGSKMNAKICDVEPDGKIIMEDEAGSNHSYYFKEVVFDIVSHQ